METEPSWARSRAAPRPPRGSARRRRLLLLVALRAACHCTASLRLPPAFAAGPGAGRSWRGLQPAPRRTAACLAASELGAAGAGEEQTAEAPPKVALANLKVGQTVQAVTKKNAPWGIFVDVGAEADGLVEYEELSDKGLPERLGRGTKVTARVLKVEAGKLWLTRRSGDLTRSNRPNWKDNDVSPFVGRPADQWFDGEVQGFLPGKGAYITVEAPGTSTLARGVLLKEEFSDGLIDSIHLGMKVRVRVLACDAEKGRLDFTMKDP